MDYTLMIRHSKEFYTLKDPRLLQFIGEHQT
jgi:hypothetical protein